MTYAIESGVAVDSPLIAPKCHYVPVGIEAASSGAAMAKFDSGPLRILFTNSLHREHRSFYLRGGHNLIEAFGRLRKNHPDAELTVVSSVPDDLMERFTQSYRRKFAELMYGLEATCCREVVRRRPCALEWRPAIGIASRRRRRTAS